MSSSGSRASFLSPASSRARRFASSSATLWRRRSLSRLASSSCPSSACFDSSVTSSGIRCRPAPASGFGMETTPVTRSTAHARRDATSTTLTFTATPPSAMLDPAPTPADGSGAGTPASTMSPDNHASRARESAGSSERRSFSSPRASQVRTVLSGTPFARAMSTGLSPSKYRRSTAETYGSSSRSTASTRRLWRSARSTMSAADGTASGRAASSSLRRRRPADRKRPRAMLRRTPESQAPRPGPTVARRSSAATSVSWTRSSAPAESRASCSASKRIQPVWARSASASLRRSAVCPGFSMLRNKLPPGGKPSQSIPGSLDSAPITL